MTAPLRIALLDAGGPWGRSERLALALASRGHEADVFLRRDDAGRELVRFPAPRARTIRVPAGAGFARFLAEFCRGVPPYDAAYALSFQAGLAAAELKRETGLPFAVSFLGLAKARPVLPPGTPAAWRERTRKEQELLDAADAVAAVSPQDELDLRSFYSVAPEKLGRLPPACALDEMRPVAKLYARQVLALAPEERLLLHAGSPAPESGLDTVIRALALLAKDGLTARVLVAGGGSRDDEREAKRALALARAEGAEGRVLFAGRRCREQMRLHYGAADMLACVPSYDALGASALEAMACARPVLGSDVGGLRNAVLDGRTGFLVPPGDAHALAERAAWLYRHPWRLRVFGWRAAQRARQFSWEAAAEAAESVCMAAAARGRAREAA